MTTERMPLIGRDAELGLLDRLLADLAADARGRPAVLDISGEAGIGKSRLAHELCRRAARGGATVLRGRATEYERHLPFQPFTDAFADLDPAVRDSFPAAAAVAPVLTGAAHHADRFGLHRATAALLAHAATAPLVMVLDDLHWADAASLELLDHLVRHPPRARVLLAVARRERQSPAPLTASLVRGTDTGAVRRTVLGPLDERSCLARLTPGLDHEEAVRLFAASEGNPLCLLALLQAHREGARVNRLSTTGLGALLLDELTPLGPAQRRLVEVVAALGDHATPALLAAVTGRAPADLAADLAELTRRDLLRAGAHGRLALRHPVLRSLVHEGTDPWRRTETHRLAAAALARAGAPPAERAHHAERSLSGWDPETAAVLIQAAEQAADTAPASCAHWLGVVLRHLPHTPDHAVRRRELTLRRARALGACGRLRESRDLLHQVIALPDPAGEEATGSRASAVVLCAVTERHLGRYSEAVALLRRELHRDDPAPSPADQVALGLELGSSAPHDTSYPTVRAEVARTLAVARSLGDEVGVAGALAVAALGEAYEGETTEADGYARQAAALVDSLPDDDLTGLCEQLARLGWAEAFLERFADAERHADRGLAVARRTGQLHLLPHLLLCKAHVHIQICRPVSAVELADEAEDIARGIGSDELLAFVLATKAHAVVAACPPGDPRPLAVAEEAVVAAGSGVNWWASVARCVLGYAALTAGDPARAREAVLQAGGPGLRRLQPSMRPLFLEVLVTSAVAVGEVDEAKEWALRAREEAERLDLPVQRASAMRSAAHIPLGLGDAAAAGDLFLAAAEESARSGAQFWEAFSLLLGAPLLAADPDGPRRGRAAWQRGRRLAAAGGSAMLTGLADAIGPAVADAVDGPERRLAELTAREQEIAALVAEGLTSPAIADRLCLSRRTVETHVSRIYRKTGVSSRAALAALIAARTSGPAFSG
ncbi:ATP-binding protein [Streptomyces sp. NBC_00582]|uniref:ATP-binding protein n=1 Tax=Streptomyces sp. NBC_00582 TaxID=2975783 RepID=UPI002E811FB2|nr:AAA family ATPase [Streptomyces sp. NBC_00582]WUB60253.1 AAA family ATPase [Streptomyces sp. NBC_00582]